MKATNEALNSERRRLVRRCIVAARKLDMDDGHIARFLDIAPREFDYHAGGGIPRKPSFVSAYTRGAAYLETVQTRPLQSLPHLFPPDGTEKRGSNGVKGNGVDCNVSIAAVARFTDGTEVEYDSESKTMMITTMDGDTLTLGWS